VILKAWLKELLKSVSTNPDKNVNQLIAEVDSIYGEKINSFDATEEIRNIFEDIEAIHRRKRE